ncbi:hypothetical protein GCM10022240_03970 [Microbacterium kribbense]|uniref:Uncharacterized protein n=1 Tax=Microbacterium kribbense TaxID=433645 RepID=A0ABP7G5V9_9MICO
MSDPLTTDPGQAPGTKPAANETRRERAQAPRVTMRFDEFVAWSDAASFGNTSPARRWVDWPRVVAWSVVGAAFASIVVAGTWMAIAT